MLRTGRNRMSAGLQQAETAFVDSSDASHRLEQRYLSPF